MLVFDFVSGARERVKLAEALGLNARTTAALGHITMADLLARRDQLRALAAKGPREAAMVARAQHLAISHEPLRLTRRGLILGSVGLIALAALPIPVKAQLAGHSPFRFPEGYKFAVLFDGLCLFNDWSSLPGYGPEDGARVVSLIESTQYSWIECCAMGGSFFGPTDSGNSGQRTPVVKLDGRNNGIRRSLMLGASAQCVLMRAENASGHSIGGRVINSVLAYCFNGGVGMSQTLSDGLTLGNIVGINNVIHDVSRNPQNSLNGKALFVRWDNNDGDWEDHIFWLNSYFNAGAEINVTIEQGGSPGDMTIEEAALEFPANFGGCFTAPSPGFVAYPGRTTYDDIDDVFADFATTGSSVLRGRGRHVTTVKNAVSNSNTLTMQDPTMFRSVALPWGHPSYGPYGAAGGMGCYIEGVGYRTFTSHSPEGSTVIAGAPITVPAGTRIWDLEPNSDVGLAQS